MSERHQPQWPPRGMREEQAAYYVGLSVSAIRTLRTRGEFPAPTPLTKGRLVFLREELDAWLDRRAGRPSTGTEDWPDA